MSEFPFDGPGTDGTEPEPRTRRVLLVGSGLLVALLLGGGAVVLTSGGGDAPAAAVTAAPARPPAATPAPAPAPSTAAAAPAAVRPGRLPFKALYVAPVAASNVGGTAAAAPAPAGTPAPAAPTTSPAAAKPYPLKLEKVDGPDAGGNAVLSWLVNGVKTTSLNGQRFGRTGELVVLSVTKDSSGVLAAWVQAGAAKPVAVKVGSTVQVL